MIFKLHEKHKLDTIAHSLTSCGIVVWHGIPEKIVKDLHAAGYKVKKRKNFKNISNQINHLATTATDDVYL